MQYRIIIIFVVSLTIGKLFAQDREVRIALCYDSTTFINPEYRIAIGKEIVRTLNALDFDLKPEVRFRSCLSLASFSFYGNEEAIFGREEALTSIVEASYWVAAMEAINYSSADNPEVILSNCGSLNWIDAFRLAKARMYYQHDELKSLLEKIKDNTDMNSSAMKRFVKLAENLHLEENDFSEKTISKKEFLTAQKIHQGIVNNVFAFVIGHEMFHFLGNKDLLTSKATAETNGFLEKMLALQQPGSLFDPNIQLDVTELRADIAGYRTLEVVDKKRDVNDDILNTIIRRASINVMAFPMLLGFDIIDLSFTDSPKVKVVKSYLYPELRLLIFSEILRRNESKNQWSVRVCGNTAQALVTIIQTHASNYPETNGDVPDEILDLLPKGVTVGWETNYWDAESFKCKPN